MSKITVSEKELNENRVFFVIIGVINEVKSKVFPSNPNRECINLRNSFIFTPLQLPFIKEPRLFPYARVNSKVGF